MTGKYRKINLPAKVCARCGFPSHGERSGRKIGIMYAIVLKDAVEQEM